MASSSEAASRAERVLSLALARPPTLGTGRLVCVDGPSGSGKTTLATALARRSRDVRVVHTDAMYDGWDGLPRIGDQLAALLGPLAAGDPGCYRRYDWHAGRYAEKVVVPPAPVLVVEGVGAWVPALAGLVTVLVWVEAPAPVRLARAVGRDGPAYEERLQQWARDEEDHFARTGARDRADLVLRAGDKP
ncbi:MAG: (d)CMP kinase [Nocardioides sp.]|nr:(d)CMP kinase [Nocardioidaceae bacterium]MCB8956505.1 (d)CMP kinase [Nocardioides sp.]